MGSLDPVASGGIKLHVHEHYLREHLNPDDRVLEIGAGPGRFTKLIVELGCRATVSDLSKVQLDLNRLMSREIGFDKGVEEWRLLDLADLSDIADESFDAIVAYGGPFSYMFDEVGAAVAGCFRCLRPGGHLLASVMSRIGTMHRFIDGLLVLPEVDFPAILASGDIIPATDPTTTHFCHMFRSDEFRSLLSEGGFEVAALSASNALSWFTEDFLSSIRKSPEAWSRLLRLELESTKVPGMIDAGTHLIGVARKPG